MQCRTRLGRHGPPNFPLKSKILRFQPLDRLAIGILVAGRRAMLPRSGPQRGYPTKLLPLALNPLGNCIRRRDVCGEN